VSTEGISGDNKTMHGPDAYINDKNTYDNNNNEITISKLTPDTLVLGDSLRRQENIESSGGVTGEKNVPTAGGSIPVTNLEKPDYKNFGLVATQKSDKRSNESTKVEIIKVEHMDSGCSESMTGDRSHLFDVKKLKKGKEIVGFNDSRTIAEYSGTNIDGKDTLVVPGMPLERDLLSAWHYTRDGPIIFFDDGGYVVALNDEQRPVFEEFVRSLPVTMRLKLSNRTYVVDYRIGSKNDSDVVRGYIANVEPDLPELVVEDALDKWLEEGEDLTFGYSAVLLAEFPDVGARLEREK